MEAPEPLERPASAVVLIGGSAGAFAVVSALLGALSADEGPTLGVVLHQPRRRPDVLSSALRESCPLPLFEPEDKEPLAPSTVFVAPAGYHLLVDAGPSFALSVDEPVNWSRPSIDVLFESAADVLGPRCAGVLLSGANADGARGLRAIEEAGGSVAVQDPREAEQRAMPDAALALCPAAQVLRAVDIRRWLQRLSARSSCG